MRDRTVYQRGSFFFSPAIILLMAGVLFDAGCGHTPKSGNSSRPGGDAKLFYSRPDNNAAEMPAKPTPGIVPTVTPPIEAVPEDRQPDNPVETPSEDAGYIISPNDVLDISVLGEENLSITVRVSEKGVISFPLLGEIGAAGYPPLQFERRLEKLLEQDYLVSPSVNITILEYSTISVLGQVEKPGAFEIKGRMTVTQAIARAGGLTNIASPNGTKVIRRINGREEIIPVRLKDILADGDLSNDISLKPGDLIVVPESFF
ncbi:MAG: polysaccharide biosynthesis/export family protein [PVC group bacterium]